MKSFIDRHLTFFKFLIFCLGCLPLILAIFSMKHSIGSNSPAGVIGGGFFLLGALYIFGYTASFLYSGTIATNLVDFLLYPRALLKAPPVILSRQKGLIANGLYKEAESELCELRLTNPAAPELALLLAELHARHFNAPDAAVADIEYYLSVRKHRYHASNAVMLLRYADFQQQLDNGAVAAQLLKLEAQKMIYTSRERKLLRQRVQLLEG